MSAPRGRPFAPGNTMGHGRPRGSRNKAKLPGQQFLDDHELHLIHKCAQMAMAGSVSAMRLCLERLTPARRDGCTRLDLPRIEKAADLPVAAAVVMRAIGRGKLTANEGGKLIESLEKQSSIIERGDTARRVEDLEAQIASRNPRNGARDQNNE
jgi:hypothetical protein